MEERKKSEVVKENLKETVREELASLTEEIPIVGSAMSKMVKIAQKTAQKTKEELEKSEKLPKYMTSIKFYCKKGQKISDDEHYEIVRILEQTFESSDEKSLASIEEFINEYVGGEVHTEFTEDVVVGTDYVWIHLLEGERFFYDEKARNCLNAVVAAFNALLRIEIFEHYEVWGHSED
ncbi:MAG: hypothetical protein NC092_07865 [Butyrivibrio sp.]|nr:hypothetical protein [Butyrivibrio sp.]